jgi:hypothetical protein
MRSKDARRPILLFPNSNTLSHIARALALAYWLEAEGFECHIGLSNSRKTWATRFWGRCHGLFELWEPSGVPFPCLHWFADPRYVEACVTSQESVIADVKPELVVGIFDFPSALSCGPIPRISINGACMLPAFEGVLGFDETPTPRRDEQQRILSHFWSFAAQSFATALEKRRMPLRRSARELLLGSVNLLYEIEEICGLKHMPPDYHPIGPIAWPGWEELGHKASWHPHAHVPTIYLNAGTLMKDERIMTAILDECLATGSRVLVSSGDQGPSWTTERVFCQPFLAPGWCTNLADVAVCTGGVGSCYTNLAYGVPSLVVPMQPEQATNGLQLQRSGCGAVYRHNVVFIGDSRPYYDNFDRGHFSNLLHRLLHQSTPELALIKERLAAIPTRERFISFVKGIL